MTFLANALQNRYMRKLTFTFLLLALLSPLFGQNIVPNSSFEQYESLPRFMSNSGRDFERSIKKWTVPNEASTDLISPRFDSKNLHTVPPKTGKNMIGIVVNGDYWAEYGKVKLKKPIEPGQEYYIEYWMSMPTYYSKKKPVPTFLNNHFGVYFGGDIYQADKRILVQTPQVRANSEDLIQPTKWVKIVGNFKATEAAEYLYIGQFMSPEGNSEMAKGYFFIDDVFVEPFTSGATNYEPSRYYQIKGNVATVKMENIYFETDKYELLMSSYDELDKLVGLLQKNPSLTIQIEGHTDDSGSENHNLELSKNRAQTVYEYVVGKGIDSNRLSSIGYGLSKPVTDNSTDENRQKNRRVEFVVEGDPELESSKTILGPEFVYRFGDEIPNDKRARQSFVGKHVKDWSCLNKATVQADPIEKKLLSKCSTQDAKQFILAKAKKEKAIFINEYPEHAQNRAFLFTMLQDLFNQGYQYLCLEAFDRKDLELTTRKYPVLSSGYYLKEPIYGDLVRQAMAMGFELISYDSNPKQIHKAMNILKRKEQYADEAVLKQTAKDWSRALNITRIYKKDPDAKIIVFTSRGSVREKQIGQYKPMASWYYDFTQINPLTIDQARMTEKCRTEEEPLMRVKNIRQPSVFLNKNKEIFIQKEKDLLTGANEKYYDIQVFHPPSSYELQRPTWLKLNGNRKTFTFNPDKHGMSYPCLVMAYLPDEDMNFAVPMDVVEIPNEREVAALMLPAGNYTFVLRDKQKNKTLDVTVE